MNVKRIGQRLLRKISCRVKLRKTFCILIMLALLIPVGIPIPAFAHDRHMPAKPKWNVNFFAAEPSIRLIGAGKAIVNSFISRLSAKSLPDSPSDLKTTKLTAVVNSNSVANEPLEAPKVQSDNQNTLTIPIHPASVLMDDDESQVIRDSTYSSENNIGNPPGKFEAESPNKASAIRIEDRAGIANFSFGVPLAALPGRGISASIGMTYNSRIWNKSQSGSSTTYTHNVDKNWIAPGFTIGYGSLTSHFEGRTIRMNNSDLKTYNEIVPDGYTDPDGTRHQVECRIRNRIPGTETAPDAGVDNYYCPEYTTKDGTFVQVIADGFSSITAYHQPDKSNYAFTSFTLVHSDGARVTYSVPGSQFGASDYSRDHYPVTIQDSNGNQISIEYLSGTDRIQEIEDTLGRLIKFYYDNSSDPKLVAITVPGFNGGAERTVARLYYQDDAPLSVSAFSGTVVAPSTYRALKYVYFPATSSGYRYDYHALGMISKITKLLGMTVSTTALDSTGTVTSNDAATTAATTEYNYEIPAQLTNVPKYDQRTDTWRISSSIFCSSTTHFADLTDPSNPSPVITVVTVPQGNFNVEYRTVADAGGFTKETSVTQVGPGSFSKLMSKSVYTWDWKAYGNVGGTFWWLKKVEVTNDVDQTRATEFDVDDYNNTKLVRECAIAAPNSQCTELRRTETTFINGSGWTNNNILRLPGTVETKVNGATVSKTVYTYDENSQLQETPNVEQHNPAYNPNQGTHQECHWECDGEPSPPRCSDGSSADRVCIDVPNNDPRYNYRGNLTKVTSYPDASGQNASVKTMSYDMTGNVIQASLSCCQVKTIEYSSVNQYAYPTKVTMGASPTQLVTFTTYDKYTGLVVDTTDENNQITSYQYDPVSLRRTQIIQPNGAWTTTEYNDSQFPYSVKTTSSLDANRSVSSWSFYNGAGLVFRNRSLTANGYLSNDVEFDSLGRPTKNYNPYAVAQLTDDRPAGIKFTEASNIDSLGRAVETTLPDGTKVHAYPDESTVTYTAPNGQTVIGTASRFIDQAGKERRQVVDALGRIVRVDEPNSSGLGSVSSPAQPTYYEFDGNDNLTKVIQSDGAGVTQERVFVYDWLSRLKRERQVEAAPTLDDNGVKGTPGPAKWTGVYKYNTDSLLEYAYDARGIETRLEYDRLNRVWRVTYSGESGYRTPNVTYTYDEARSNNGVAYSNRGRLTTVQTEAVSVPETVQSTPATVQIYNYNKVGQVVDHTQTIDGNSYNLKYEYNLAGQLVSETYPSGRVVTTTVDNFGVPQTVADAQRTYVNGITFGFNASGMTSQMTLGNGTVENNIFNERFQLTSQSLTRGSDVLQKYVYTYATVNLDDGNPFASSNNGQLGKIESYIGANKQWSQRFGYDELGRLKEAREYKQGDNSHLSYKQVFDFDRFGNLYRKASNNQSTGQETPVPLIAIEEATGPGTGDIDKATNRFRTGTTYDDAGEVTTDSKFRNMGFAYDANGRQIKATAANTPDALTVYDALGNRVATKINDVWQYMIYDAFGQLVAEYGASSTDGTGGAKYVHQDWQGSVRAITNSNGYVVARTDHQAFGEDIGLGVGLRSIDEGYSADKVTRQGFGMTENDDATGQQHAWFRKLETAAGRWDSPDPYITSMNHGNPQSFNRYSYVGNQPHNFVDPKGLLGIQTCTIYGGELQCYTSMTYSGADIGNSGDGIYITTSIYQPYVEARPDLLFQSYAFIPFFADYQSGWGQIINDAVGVANEALKKPDCKKLFSIFGNPTPSPYKLPGDGTPGSALQTINARKQIRYRDIDVNIAHAVVDIGPPYNSTGEYNPRETILVNSPFFSDRGVGGSIAFSQASRAQIEALSPEQARALLLIHELLHLYYNRGHESSEPNFKNETLNDQILWNCF